MLTTLLTFKHHSDVLYWKRNAFFICSERFQVSDRECFLLETLIILSWGTVFSKDEGIEENKSRFKYMWYIKESHAIKYKEKRGGITVCTNKILAFYGLVGFYDTA